MFHVFLKNRFFLILIFLISATLAFSFFHWSMENKFEYLGKMLQLLVFSKIPIALFVVGYFGVCLNYKHFIILYILGGFLLGSLARFDNLNPLFSILAMIYLLAYGWLWILWGSKRSVKI